MTEYKPFYTDEEASTVIKAAVTAAGPGGQTEEQLKQVLDWIQETRLNEAALKLVLAGEMAAFVKDGEMIWKTPTPEENTRP